MFSKPAGPALPRRAANLQCWRLVSAAVLLACAAVAMPDGAGAQTAPAKPTGFATEDGNTQVRLRWTGPNDPTITAWEYTYGLQTGPFGGWTEMPGSDAGTRRFTVTGLQNNRTYKFKVRAVNDTGSGRESDEKSAETYLSVPEKPAGFRAISGDRKAVLMWNDADDVSIRGWEYRQKESGDSYGAWLPVPGSDARTTSYTVTGLENGTGYTFQIQAWNSTGTGYRSDEESATPMPSVPEKPAGFSVEAGNRKATLTWNDPDDDTISKWQYSYKTTEDYGSWIDMPGSGADTVRHVVSMLANDMLHKFRIRAVNNVGDGVGIG